MLGRMKEQRRIEERNRIKDRRLETPREGKYQKEICNLRLGHAIVEGRRGCGEPGVSRSSTFSVLDAALTEF